MSHRVDWTPRARRDLRRLDRAIEARVIEAVERFAATGRGDIAKLTAVTPPEYRLRVGDWRVRFAIAGDAVVVLHVLRRDAAYRQG